MANTKKMTRKELLKSPDKFFTTSERVYNWLRENCWIVLLAVGVILAIGLGYGLIGWNKERRTMAAMAAYDQAGLLLNDGKPEEAEAALKKLLADYPGSGPARFTLLDLSRLSQDRGELGRALELTNKLLETLGKNEASLKPFVFDRLGSLYEIDGQFDRAADYFRKTLDFPALKESGLFNLARVLRTQDKKPEALALYEQLVKEYPASQNLPWATYNIALLSPPLSVEEPAQDSGAAVFSEEEPEGDDEAGEASGAAIIEEDLTDDEARTPAPAAGGDDAGIRTAPARADNSGAEE